MAPPSACLLATNDDADLPGSDQVGTVAPLYSSSSDLRPYDSPPPKRTRRTSTLVGLLSLVCVVMLGTLASPLFIVHADGSLPHRLVALDTPRTASLGLAAEAIKALGLELDTVSFQCAESLWSEWGLDPVRSYVNPILSMPKPSMDFLALLAARNLRVATWDDIRNNPLSEFACASAHYIVSTMTSRFMPRGQLWNQPSTAEMDWGPAREFTDMTAWDRMVSLHEQTERALIAVFDTFVSGSPVAVYLRGCAKQVITSGTPPFEDVQPHLRRPNGDSAHPHMSKLPFSARFKPTPTLRLPKARQKRNTSYRPRHYGDILEATALDSLLEWLKIHESNMQAVKAFGKAARRAPNAPEFLGYGQAIQPQQTLVIGQDQFLPEARGIIWDCAGFGAGLPAVPMDFDAPINTGVDRDTVQRELTDWPDQELVGFLLDGVQFRADLPLQIVLCPHLTSLAAGYASVQREVVRLSVVEKYTSLHNYLPTMPIRTEPQGSEPRRLEPDRPRRTSDGGAPRRAAFDGMGIQAVSLNAAIGLRDWTSFPAPENLGDAGPFDSEDQPEGPEAAWDQPMPKWTAPEVKPQVQDKAHDDGILRHAALFVFHEPLLGFTDDYKDYFNHFGLAKSEYWLKSFTWLFDSRPVGNDAPGVFTDESFAGFDRDVPLSLTFSQEERLGFGNSLAPNVAQRAGCAIVEVFRQRFDAEEEVLFNKLLDPTSNVCVPYSARDALTWRSGWTDVCRWIDDRRQLSALTGNNELRRYAVHIYTDDPIFSGVGSDTLVRMMRTWFQVNEDFGMKMAIARKRQVGTRMTWLGFNFFLTSGIITATPEKLSKGREVLNQILDGSITTFDQYRRLLGLLEHLLLFVGADRSFMYGLYGQNFRRGLMFGPATRMVFGRQQLESLGRWLYTLTTGGGCFFSMALSSPTIPLPEKGLALLPPDSNLLAPRPISGEEFHLYSDAAVEDTSGGLGGWVHGECWHFPLSQADRDLLHITAWEFVALGINIIIFGRRLSGFQVHLLADALATVQVMFHRAAHSPHMQCIHRLILALPELACLGPLRSENHVFGEVNICADAASRGRFDLLRLLGRQFGLDVRRLPLPARAFEFLRQVRQAIHASNESEGATHSSDPAPRPQGRVELELMQHRGAPFYRSRGPASSVPSSEGHVPTNLRVGLFAQAGSSAVAFGYGLTRGKCNRTTSSWNLPTRR